MTSHSIEGLSDGGLREKIARVIDPEAFQPCNDIPSFPNECCVTREGCSCFHWPENALAKADAILALSAVPSDGWVLVPREPTEAMINNAHDSYGDFCGAQGIWAAMLSATPERVEGGGWRPIAEARGKPGTYINVRSVTTYRWLEYKPDGKRQMRRDGRWQKAVGDYGGWQNEELPERGEFRPNLPASASPPIGAEGGRATSAGDSGCGEEVSPSGAQSDDGRGG